MIKSTVFPDIPYSPGEALWLEPGECGQPFYFDVTEDLTADPDAMEKVALFLDELQNTEKKAIAEFKEVLKNEQNPFYTVVKYFLEFHKNELDEADLKNLLGIDYGKSFSLEKMIDYLKLNRVGSLIDEDLKQQVFITDWSFNPDVSDELLVMYFNPDMEIILITHES